MAQCHLQKHMYIYIRLPGASQLRKKCKSSRFEKVPLVQCDLHVGTKVMM